MPKATRTEKPAPPERPERPHKTLTQTQEEIADLASDLILNGGAHEDVDMMLTALLRHQWRRYSFGGRNGYATPAEREQLVRERAEAGLPRTHRSLSAHWPEPKSDGEHNAPTPKTVAEMVHANIRGSLRYYFENFLTDSYGIEPAWLLNEILENTESEGRDLVQGIYDALDRADIYVRVPYEHKKRIEDFVDFLEKEVPKVA